MEDVIAIDLGATNTRVALVDRNGKVIARVESATPKEGGSADAIPAHLVRLVERLLQAEDAEVPLAIGVSAAGPVDIGRGVVVNPPNIPFREIPIVEPLSRAFGVPVRMANDCHAGVIGEAYFGRAQHYSDVVYITISTGIGGGVVANGQLLLGRGGNAAEIGHFHVDSTYRIVCGCGHEGHWEGYAAGRFLPSFFRAWAVKHGHEAGKYADAGARELLQAAREGNRPVSEFLDALAVINARGVSNVIVAYDPSLIIWDGSVVRMNRREVLEPLKEHVDRFLPMPEMALSPLGGDAPLLGAAVIARGYRTRLGPLTKE